MEIKQVKSRNLAGTKKGTEFLCEKNFLTNFNYYCWVCLYVCMYM